VPLEKDDKKGKKGKGGKTMVNKNQRGSQGDENCSIF
jgi:hypothetical protein